ncbi:class I adenylate-forming enzyme family protein [Actinomycetospora sp. C-140]
MARQSIVRADEIALASAEPDATGPTVTWSQLEERTGRLAAWLQAAGAHPGDRIAMLADNDPRIFELQFACMRLGAVFVPLSWRLAMPELKELVADCTPVVLVTCDQWAEAGDELAGSSIVRLTWGDSSSSYEQALADQTNPLRRSTLDPDAVTHVLYTSGTTGRPRGVMCTNRNLTNHANNFAHAARAADRYAHALNFLPMFHAGGLNTLNNAILYWGGRVTTMNRFDHRLALRLLTDAEFGATHSAAVLQNLERMMELPEFEEATFPTLHTMVTGAWGPAAPGVYRAWSERGLFLRLGYGGSELGPHVAIVQTDDPTAADRATSGPVLPHHDVLISDPDGGECAQGEVGEILVRGPGVTPGYWNLDSTPFFTDGWFRTGDAGVIDEFGELHIVARLKEMYRSAGENVYPAEVETVLLGMDGIADVGVVGIPHERWGETGLAVVVPEEGREITLAAVREFGAERIARFKLPSELLIVDELPRSVTAKVSRHELLRLWEERLS